MNDFYLITLDDGIEEGWGPFFLLVCGGGNEGVRAERAWTKATQRRKKEGLLFCLASVLLFSFCIFFLLNECSSVCAICLFGLFFLFFSILPGPLSFVFFLSSVFIISHLLISRPHVVYFLDRLLSFLLLLSSFLSLNLLLVLGRLELLLGSIRAVLSILPLKRREKSKEIRKIGKRKAMRWAYNQLNNLKNATQRLYRKDT